MEKRHIIPLSGHPVNQNSLIKSDRRRPATDGQGIHDALEYVHLLNAD